MKILQISQIITLIWLNAVIGLLWKYKGTDSNASSVVQWLALSHSKEILSLNPGFFAYSPYACMGSPRLPPIVQRLG